MSGSSSSCPPATTRTVPGNSATKIRPSGAQVIAAGKFSPVPRGRSSKSGGSSIARAGTASVTSAMSAASNPIAAPRLGDPSPMAALWEPAGSETASRPRAA